MRNEIMSLDIKINYKEILKNKTVLDGLTKGQLKGIHYRLHQQYNIKSIQNRIKKQIYLAHNTLIEKYNQLDLTHKKIDKLDEIYISQRKMIIKKPEIVKIVNKRKVFLLRKSIIKKNG